jgi:hypothetical protein
MTLVTQGFKNGTEFFFLKLDNFGVMPGFLYYMTLKKDVFSCDCYYK